MIKSVEFHRFKKYKSTKLDIKPGVVILAGGNNSGKTTFLQGLSVWQFCRTVIEMERGKEALCIGSVKQGIGLSIDDFSPINLPSLNHIWTNLKAAKEYEDNGYTLWIELCWEDQNNIDKHIRIGLSLANDRLFIKTLKSNVSVEESIPEIAYIPPFAGIVDKEPFHTMAIRKKLIGQGLSGAVIRNVLLDLYNNNQVERNKLKGDKTKIGGKDLRELRKTDPWENLLSLLQNSFNYGISVHPFNTLYHSYIKIDCFKGTCKGSRFVKHTDYTPRDIMVEGSGFLQWLTVIALTLDPSISMILLDEPDSHLHPSLQNIMISELRDIAHRFDKQILFATHSPELIKQHPTDGIIQFTDNRKPRYLQEETQKVALLAGIGSEYSPLYNRLQKTKKIMFVENDSDQILLTIFSERLNIEIDSNIVFWPYIGRHKERKTLFNEMKKEISGLRGISLNDRDDEPINTVDSSLHDKYHTDDISLLFRKWRRRNIESYLLHPESIARTVKTDATKITKYIIKHFAIDIGDGFVSQDEPDSILQINGKHIISEGKNSIHSKSLSGKDKYDIARQMNATEISIDISVLLNEMKSFFQ